MVRGFDRKWAAGLAAVALTVSIDTEALAEACVVHSQAERLNVQVCQQNISIPPQLFHDGFCEPTLAGQKVTVEYVDQCPSGAFGICTGAQVENMPYRQDIHYYGVTSDAAYLRPFCEQKSQGKWLTPLEVPRGTSAP